jgi:starch-binding outer membrane protein, SusD/RagB family
MRKILRNRKIALPLTFAFLFSSLSCSDSFLEVPATASLTEEVLTSRDGLEGLLIGTYSVINGRGNGWHAGATNWLWGSIRGGDANKGTNAGDFSSMNPVERFELDPNNTEVHAKWLGSYEGVARANKLLSLIPLSTDLTDEQRTRITGEARFLRGHFYFELKKNFNMVPYVDETMDVATGATEVKNDTDIWSKINDDLKFAYDNLPETQAEVGRANKWAAGSYLGKALLFQQSYAQALTVFNDVIANGQTSDGKDYALFPNFGTLFRLANENSEESIFAYQATGGASSTDNANHEYAMNYPYNTLPGSCCGFFHPSFDLAASYRTDDAGLPLLDKSYRDAGNLLVTDQGMLSNEPGTPDEFTPDAGNLDPRLDHTIGRRGIPFLDWGPHLGNSWIRDQSYAGPYTPKKYTYAKSEESSLDKSGWTPGYIATNYMLIRYADVLLMAAECEVEVGDLEIARDYVNQVRDRAANTAGFVKNGAVDAANYVIGTYDAAWSDQDFAREAVRFERKLELGLEGHRFYDLVRWGIADAEIDSYLLFEAARIPSHFGGATFTPNEDEYLPIPQRQIDLQGSDILTQNPGF